MELKLKNYYIDPIMKTISYSMPFGKGAVRNSFRVLFATQAQEIEKRRNAILIELTDKGEDGKPIIEVVKTEEGDPIPSKKVYKLSEENKVKWQAEYSNLLLEDCVITVPFHLNNMIGVLKDIIYTSNAELDDRETSIMEQVMQDLNEASPRKKK